MLTLNQIIRRIRVISLAHKQIRNFYFGLPSDFLTDKKTQYAGIFLQDVSGVVDLSGKSDTLSFKMFALDLVHVSDETGDNELDVQSDMREVLKDLLASMNHSSYTDWKISTSNVMTLLSEKFDDMVAGAVIDISIVVPYDQDVCAVPTEEINEVI